MIEYLTNPQLPSINEDFRGNIFINGQFEMEAVNTRPVPFSTILQWQFNKKEVKKAKKAQPYQVPLQKEEHLLDTSGNWLAWLGHSSFLIRLGGKIIITDPCLTDLPFIKRLVGLPFSFEKLQNIDYLLISHGHRDHYDQACIHKLIEQNPAIQLLMPLKISSLLGKYRSRTSFQEAGWYQQFNTGSSDLSIYFLPAKHWNRRGLFDYNRTLWGSFWIQYKDVKLYFAGDTAYYSHFAEIKKVLGTPDICLMPVGAYRPAHIMNEAHTSPIEAVRGFHDLGGETFIPMHYGTYDLADEPLGEPIALLTHLQTQGQLNGHLQMPAVGELFPLV
ncbi:MAG: MBL fold metallo-hydrolase [Bacteroidota bacterium]